MFKKNKGGLARKLQKAVTNLSADIFGYEKKVSAQVVRYFQDLSRKHLEPIDKLAIRIDNKSDLVRVFLFNRIGLVNRIPTKELVLFFTNSATAQIFNLEHKVIESVRRYIIDLSKKFNIEIDELNIKISTDGNEVVVKVFDKEVFVERVPIHELVKYFK